MKADKNRLVPILLLVTLVGLALGVWLYMASDWLSKPVEQMEASDLSDDPVFARHREPEPVIDAGQPAQSKDVGPDPDVLPGHGFCPADGRSRTVNLKQTLRFLLDSSKNPDRQESLPKAYVEAEAPARQAARQRELKRAAKLSRQLVKEFPDQPRAHIMAALVAQYANDHIAVRRALSQAYRLDSSSPFLALAYGAVHSNAPDLDQAIEALDVFLEFDRKRQARTGKQIAAPYQLRARLDLRRELQRDFYRLQEKGVVLLANPELPREDAETLLELVVESLREAARITRTRRRPELTVVVYRDRSELLAVTCSANWAGGIFDGTLRLQSGKWRSRASWQLIIRHESVHAQLSWLPVRVPTWFNEGLAQLVAGQFGWRQIETFERMLNNRTYIPFAHMFQTFVDFDSWEFAKVAYHQGLAMLIMMMELGGENAVGEGIAFLEAGGLSQDLMEHVAGKKLDGSDLLDYLEKWKNNNWMKPKSPIRD